MKRFARSPSQWPITAKVPTLVVVLMLVVSAVITQQVLSRLAELQRQHFDELAASYLDGLSSSLLPAVLREDVWETFDILDRARGLYRGLKTNETLVANGQGTVCCHRSGGPSFLLACEFRHQSALSGRPAGPA